MSSIFYIYIKYKGNSKLHFENFTNFRVFKFENIKKLKTDHLNEHFLIIKNNMIGFNFNFY